MKSTNKRKDRAPAGNPSLRNEVFNGLYLNKCWSKGDPCKPETTRAITKAIGCSLQTAGKALLLKTPTQLIEHDEVLTD